VRASSQYIDLGTNASLRITGAITLGVWFKANSDYTSAQALIGSSGGGGTTGDYALTLGYTDNKLDFWRNAGGPAVTSVASISDNNWHHFAASAAGAAPTWTLNVYVDGELDNTVSPWLFDGGVSTQTCIGRFGDFPGYYMQGLEDEARISTGARSDAWIKHEYTVVNTGLTYGAIENAPAGGRPLVNAGLVNLGLVNGGLAA
jgi:hypothetical protein